MDETPILVVFLLIAGIAVVVVLGALLRGFDEAVFKNPQDNARLLREIAPRATIPSGYEIVFAMDASRVRLVVIGPTGTSLSQYDRERIPTLIVLAALHADCPQVEMATSIANIIGYQYRRSLQPLPIAASVGVSPASLQTRYVTYHDSNQRGIEHCTAFRVDADHSGLLSIIGPESRFDRTAMNVFLEDLK